MEVNRHRPQHSVRYHLHQHLTNNPRRRGVCHTSLHPPLRRAVTSRILNKSAAWHDRRTTAPWPAKATATSLQANAARTSAAAAKQRSRRYGDRIRLHRRADSDCDCRSRILVGERGKRPVQFRSHRALTQQRLNASWFVGCRGVLLRDPVQKKISWTKADVILNSRQFRTEPTEQQCAGWDDSCGHKDCLGLRY